MAKKARKKFTQGPASLAIGSPDVPTLTQHHSLQAASLETLPPELKPAPKRVHHLESGDSTIKRKPRGRRQKISTQVAAQAALESWCAQQPKLERKPAIRFVKKDLGIKASDRTIRRRIVAPVFKKLKFQK